MVEQLIANIFYRTGMAGVPGTASAIFEVVKDVGANVIMISQVVLFSYLCNALHNISYKIVRSKRKKRFHIRSD